MHSISQRTPFGRSLTAKQLLAGFDVKYFAYTSLNAAKSAISARKQVVLTTLSIPEPAASSIAATFLQLCSVCAVIPSGTSPFSGLTGICPDVKTSPFVINPCEYGPIAPGAFFVSITAMISSFQVFDIIYMMIGKTSIALESTQSLVMMFYRYAFEYGHKGYAAAISIFIFLIIYFLLISVKYSKK